VFQIGDLKIYPICDAVTHVDGGGMFGLVPRVLWSRYIQPDDLNLIPSNSLCLLVKADDKNILVDTAFGVGKLNEKQLRQWGLTRPHGSLMDALGRLGLAPEDIDLVINTHLHADHCTGNTYLSEDGKYLPTFPKAKHFTQRQEYQDAMQPNERTRATYFPENYEPLLTMGHLELLDDPETEIVRGVKMVVTPGHTPAHMSVVFESGGQHAMFLCDLSSMAIHFERIGWMTAYDVEPLVTLETKRRWQTWALEHDALLMVVHDTLKPAARLRLDKEGNPYMEAVACEYV
jgi:glyoxylase-like metal-dependent hydrolase (beta-lactamase superfamily II)